MSQNPGHLAEYLRSIGVPEDKIPDAMEHAQKDFGRQGQKTARWGSMLEGKTFTVTECNCKGILNSKGNPYGWTADYTGSHVGREVFFAHVQAGGYVNRYHMGGLLYVPKVISIEGKGEKQTMIEKHHALLQMPYTVFAEHHKLEESGSWLDAVNASDA